MWRRRRRGSPSRAALIAVVGGLTLAAGGLLGGPAGAPWPGRAGTLDLRHVDFLGLERLGAGELAARAGLVRGTPLFDLDPASIAARLSEHPRVAAARALRLPPHRLLVDVRERQPVGRLSGEPRAIDAEGHVFPLAEAEEQALPRVEGEAGQALPLLAAARALGIDVSHVTVEGPGSFVFSERDRSVRVRVGGDVEGALRGWIAVREGGWLAKVPASEVDLRFEGSAILRDIRKNEGG